MTAFVHCELCNGTGHIISYSEGWLHVDITVTHCPECNGKGKRQIKDDDAPSPYDLGGKRKP